MEAICGLHICHPQRLARSEINQTPNSHGVWLKSVPLCWEKKQAKKSVSSNEQKASLTAGHPELKND